MITKLTAEQEAAMEPLKNEFLALGLSTADAPDAAELAKLFAKVYECGGLKPPTEVILVDSPVAIIETYEQLAKANGTSGTKLSASEVISNLAYGSLDAGWLSYYNFFRRHVPEVTGLEIVDGLTGLLGRVSMWLGLDNLVIVSRNPVEIRMENERLHRTDGPAVRYADGKCDCYSLYGTAVEESTIELLKKGDIKGVLKIKNADVRVVAMKALGAEAVLKGLGGKSIDTKGAEYELYEVSIEGRPNKLLRMQNPSEPKMHYEFVPPEVTTVTQALAWRIGWNLDATFAEPRAKT